MSKTTKATKTARVTFTDSWRTPTATEIAAPTVDRRRMGGGFVVRVSTTSEVLARHFGGEDCATCAVAPNRDGGLTLLITPR